MKRINNIFIYTIIAFLSIITIVNAEECSVVDKNEIKTKASNIRIVYQTGVEDVKAKDYDDQEVDSLSRYVDIKIFNISSDLFIRMKSSGEKATIEDVLLDYKNMGPDGTITVRLPALDVVSEYTFEIFSYSENCKGDIVRTIRLTIPKYNFYSQLEACADAKESYLCQEYITFDLDQDKFYEQLKDYKEKGATDADVLVNQTVALNKIASFSSKAKYVIVSLLIAGGLVITFFIIKNNRKKNGLWK
jgi:hypothetical protein